MEKPETEQEVVFKASSDLTVLAVQTEDTHESIFEISGYDLQMNVNRDIIHSVEDVENLLDGIKDLFRKIILKELLDDNNA